MTDINKAIRAELERLYLTGHDIGDAGYPDPHKTDDSYIDASLAKIKALVVESIGEDEVVNRPDDLHKLEPLRQRAITEVLRCRNKLRGEIRSIYE